MRVKVEVEVKANASGRKRVRESTHRYLQSWKIRANKFHDVSYFSTPLFSSTPSDKNLQDVAEDRPFASIVIPLPRGEHASCLLHADTSSR